MIEAVDKVVNVLEHAMPYSVIALFFAASIFVVFLADRIYTQKGRVWTDVIWLVSGSITVFLVGLGIQYDPIVAKAKLLYERAFEIRQIVGHEADYVYRKWCGQWDDSPAFNGDEETKLKICSVAENVRNESVSIGFQYISGVRWESFPSYRSDPNINYGRSPKYQDILIMADFKKTIPYYVGQYNGAAAALRKLTSEIRIAVVVKLVRLLFLNLAACAAAFRLGRAVFELNQMNKNK